jgi:hypothetical protein
MLRKILAVLASPLIILGWLIQWLHGVSTPAPVRRANAHLSNSQSLKQLLDEAEAAEEAPTPKIERHGPALLPPAAALAQAAHVLTKSPAPDLSYVLPAVQEWIRGITPDEALMIRVMPRKRLEDHAYGRCRVYGLRPVDYDAPSAFEYERHQEEIDDPAYLDEILCGLAPRC